MPLINKLPDIEKHVIDKLLLDFIEDKKREKPYIVLTMGCRQLSYYQSEEREAKKKTPFLLRTVWRKNESSRSDVNYSPFGSSMPGRT